MKIMNKLISVLQWTKYRTIRSLYSFFRSAKSVYEALVRYGDSIIIASSYIAVIALLVLTVLDPNFRTGMIDRIDSGNLVVANALQGGLNAIVDSFSNLGHALANWHGII
ncbi:MAG: hypothetical protein M0Z77_10380 [Thermoplasmatales archaeon]|jgi:hypothetical protein|nr:hypothetical protein [Candidatus Thermoplasmatota archaeon]MCL6003357.1 hypothetical protein [Candidatus Thermoplasmatota archaeon]MDA8056033.1 hypothetical protein [Thermoplasmatales archaeon]